MSGIYIPGMKLPESCYDNCPCQGLHWCNVLKEITEPMTGKRLDNCPLVEVPDHGRLIDADALRQDWLENGENEYVYDTNSFLDSIDDAPTVIPADHADKGDA